MSKMMGATENLARFSVATDLKEIPNSVIEVAKLMILDTFGVMLAGSRDIACQILSQWVRSQEALPLATVIGQGFRSSPILAGLANSHAAHVLDFDEFTHLSTHTLPAALALGEPGHISGAKILRAYILGYEVGFRLDAAFDGARGQNRGPTFRGWHHTGTNGSLAAAVSAGLVLGLNVNQMRSAFGIAANGASGLRANMGTMAKALVAGNAAHNGVMAATLAQRGFMAEEAIIEVPQGFADAFCLEGEANWEALTLGLGERYALERGPTTKGYPCCTPANRPIDALLKLIREHGIRADDVDYIECDPHLFSLRRHEPLDAHAGQYSLEYCLSVSLIDEKLGLDQMTDERVRAPDVQALIRRLKIVPLKQGPLSRQAKEPLTVYLRDGQSKTAEIERPRSFHTAKEIEAKFLECALRAISREMATRLEDAILNLENLSDITTLLEDIHG